MKKEITIYELLGLIKDKKAPKRVKYKDSFWDFEKQFNDYYNYMNYLIGDQINFWEDVKLFLEEKVEIIEEPKELEELNLDTDDLKGKEIPRAIDYLLEGRINEIIRYIKDKENKNGKD